MSMARFALGVATAALLAACATTAARPLYFDDPEGAVREIDAMLRAEDWETLARYYRLEGGDVPPAALESGDFFVVRRHPFPPGARFVESRDLKAVGEVEVVVEGESGIAAFVMFRSPEGYRILPREAPTR